MHDILTIATRWEDVTTAWMTAAIAAHHPGAEVADVALLKRDDGTNRRARFGITYAAGSGPATIFAKAESDVPGRREIHARNGNLFNEPLLFGSGIALPVEHPFVYTALIDEPGLDYVIVMEDLVARGADPRDATRPMTVDQVGDGVRALARLHSRYWDEVESDPTLRWVQPFLPSDGWLVPMKTGVQKGLERAGQTVPDEVRELGGEELVRMWVRFIRTLTSGSQTLPHGDPHLGNTYVLPTNEVGFLDWQVVRRGNWSHDVGYFVQSVLTEQDRRDAETDLLEEYRRRLDVPDHERPMAEEVWLRYRASAAHGLAIWLVTLLSKLHAHEASLAFVQRYATAFAEFDTPAALDALEHRERDGGTSDVS